jgi:NhaA family Na+:H+ antiporter
VAVVVALALLSRLRVYLLSPYILLGVALWAFVYAGGLQPTLAGVVLALFIPTRSPADLAALLTQASTIIASEARHQGEVLRHGPSTPALHALDAIYDGLESPADRCYGTPARGRATLPPDLRTGECGCGDQPERLRWAWLAHRCDRRWPRHRKAARRFPRSCRGCAHWHSRQAGGVHVAAVGGAGALAGIGFTISLFIAGQAFPGATDFSAAKIAVFAASILSAVVGTALGCAPSHRLCQPDGSRLVEDNFAAAMAAFLNKLTLDGTIEHLVVVSDPGPWGRCASTSTAT